MEYGLGVDLGTTYTAAAVRVNGRVEVVHLGSRRAEIPSLVFIGADGTVLIGEPAERRGAAEPARLAREFKRRVGDPVSMLIGGEPYSAHALMARLLEQVQQTVAQRLDATPTVTTVTHPANWGPYKRELLGQAVRLAELENVVLRSEPEAAAIQYAAGERLRPDELVAVYDLGGGTFDAAVLRKTTTGFEVLGSPEGIEQLGGIDFDEAVFGHVMATLGSAAGQLDVDDEEMTAALTRLRRDCVEAKEALSYDTETMIPVALPGLHTRVRLNRSEFEAMIASPLADTVAAMRRALRSAAVVPADLKAVLLAGGSSRIPLVGQLIAAELDRPIVLDAHPEHSIALGAALAAVPVAAGAPTGVAPGTAPATPTESSSATVPADAAAGPPAERKSRRPRAATRPSRRTVASRLGPRTRWVLVAAAVVALGTTLAIVRPWSKAGDSGRAPAAAVSSARSPSSAPACGFADEFDGGTVDTAWEKVQPVGGFVVAGGSVEINAPDGSDIYETELRAPMLLRVPSGDFVLETEVIVNPGLFYQGAGLVLWNGSLNYVRLERGFGDVGVIIFEYRNGGSHIKVNPPDSRSPKVIRTAATRVRLQLSKTATTVSARWRTDEDPGWREIGAIDIALPNYTKAGVAVLNRAQSGAKPAPFTARFEYVRVTC